MCQALPGWILRFGVYLENIKIFYPAMNFWPSFKLKSNKPEKLVLMKTNNEYKAVQSDVVIRGTLFSLFNTNLSGPKRYSGRKTDIVAGK